MENKKLSLPICILYIVSILFVGVILGAITSVVSNLIYIVFLFPLILGFIAAWALNSPVKRCRIRSKTLILSLSIAMGLAIYGTYHFTNYITFRGEMAAAFVHRLSEEGNTSSATGEEIVGVARAFTDYALREETGQSGFLGYMLYEAKAGVSIGKFYNDNGLNLGPIFTWVYWLFELTLTTGIIFTINKGAKTDLFCEQCQDWITPKKHLGGVEEDQFQSLQDFIQQKNFTEVSKLLTPSVGIPSMEVYIKSCGCEISDLTLSRTSFNAKNDIVWQNILKTDITSTQLSELRKFLTT